MHHYSHHTTNSLLEETGDNITFINIFIKKEDQSLVDLPISITYDDLYDFIKIIDQPAFLYLQNCRNDIGSYGPKHNEILEILTAEGFDLEKYIMAYTEQIDPNKLAQHIAWSENMKKGNNANIANEKVESLKEIVNEDYINYNIQFNNYKEAIDQKLHEVTFEFFPELFEKNPEILKKYKSLLVNTTLNFTSSIDKLIYTSNS
jgi:hypothetical protein